MNSETSKLEQQADVVIIGAGITAIGVARGLADKGLTSVLVDPCEPASMTSNNSLRIIHGGIRYLQQLDFQRSLKSIKAQDQLLKEYPDVIEELSCLMPLKKLGVKSYLPMLIASKIYSSLLKKANSSVKRPVVLSSKDAPEAIKACHNNGAGSYFNWFDAQIKDQLRLASRELAKIREKNAFVQDLVVSVSCENNRYITHLARGPLIRSQAVVNAAAMGGTAIEFNNISTKHCLHWARAFNFIFSCPDIFSKRLNQAFTVRSKTGREYFLVPRQTSEGEIELAIGTFYFPVDQQVSDQDLELIVQELNQLAPVLNLDFSQVRYVESGELPCHEPFRKESSILKEDLIYQDSSYWQVYTPKYTTYQIFGETVAKQVYHELKTNNS